MTPDAEVAVIASEAGAAVIRSMYGADVARYAKSGSDFATEADIEAERAIKDTVRAAFPHDAFLGEEGGLDGPDDAARTWLVDPLCGTLNFAATTPLVGVNVALRESRRVTAAAVTDPFAGETMWTDGAVARLRTADGERDPAPSPVTQLIDIDFDGDPAWAASVARDTASRFGIRVVSTSLAAAWVALGRRAAYVQIGDVRDSVHFAAPIAVCQAAGCIVTGLRGEPVDEGPHGLLIAADAATHETLIAVLRDLG